MSDTILGVIIGGSFTLGGVFINIITNFIMEKLRNKHGRADVISKKRDEIYLKIYKLCYKYIHNIVDKSALLNEIYELTLELKVYGSRKINSLFEALDLDDNVSEVVAQIEEILKRLRDELRVGK